MALVLGLKGWLIKMNLFDGQEIFLTDYEHISNLDRVLTDIFVIDRKYILG